MPSFSPPPHFNAPHSQSQVLLRRSVTWTPEAMNIPREIVRQARTLAREASYATGRREAITRYLLAVAGCEAGWLSYVTRIALFQAPGILVADPHRETFYWALDPGVPAALEERGKAMLSALLRAVRAEEASRSSGADSDPDAGLGRTASFSGR